MQRVSTEDRRMQSEKGYQTVLGASLVGVEVVGVGHSLCVGRFAAAAVAAAYGLPLTQMRGMGPPNYPVQGSRMNNRLNAYDKRCWCCRCLQRDQHRVVR